MASSSGHEGGQKKRALNGRENVGHNVMDSNPMLLELMSKKEDDVKENHLVLPVEEVDVRGNHALMPSQESVGRKEDHPSSNFSVEGPVPVIVATINANKNKDLSALLLSLNKGANVHERCPFGNFTALHITNSCNVVYLLFEFGADINAIDEEGDTPLQMAAKKSNWEVIEALLILGARVDEKNAVQRFVGHMVPSYCRGNHSGCTSYTGYSEPWGCSPTFMDNSIPPPVFHASFADMYNGNSLFSGDCIWKYNTKVLMIKFKQAGYKNDLTDLMISKNDNTSDGFASQCSLEVEKMKKVNFNSFRNFNLYDVLMKGLTECSYATNNELCNTIESEQFVQDFPLYHSLLRIHLRIAKRRHIFLDEAVYSIDKCLKEPQYVQLPIEMYRMVFSYLSSSDLIRLNKALNRDFVVTWD